MGAQLRPPAQTGGSLPKANRENRKAAKQQAKAARRLEKREAKASRADRPATCSG
jgi:hypothetical protein